MDVIAYGIPVMDLLINIDHGLAPNESIDRHQPDFLAIRGQSIHRFGGNQAALRL